MKRYKLMAFGTIISMLIIVAIIMVNKTKPNSEDQKEITLFKYNESNSLSGINEDFTVNDNFISNLPLIIIDTNGIEPPINTKFTPYDMDNTSEGIYLPIEGVEPYLNGKISIINSEDGLNSLKDEPEYSGNMVIKRRGNSSMSYEKAQWLFKLKNDSGDDYEANLLGMGEDSEWILNGSMTDKSMLRNYIAYKTASKFMEYTPDCEYCEVILKNKNTYTYQGLYLLIEKISQGESRVNIKTYDSSSSFMSYMLRRDRYDVEAISLENYGRKNELYDEYLAVLYPSSKKLTKEGYDYINSDISYIEKILYSNDPKVFSTYSDVIDVDSFVDYFLINEYFGNYDAGNNSTYLYKDIGEKLKIGPVWDFDGAIDNYKYEAFNENTIAFYQKPWFNRLCLDKKFITKLEKRYIELKHSYLDSNIITKEIDKTVCLIQNAVDREWYRWNSWYTTENIYSLNDEILKDGTVIKRNALTYNEEICKIKSNLREHSKYIYTGIQTLEKSTKFDTGSDLYIGWLLLIAALIFFIPALKASFTK